MALPSVDVVRVLSRDILKTSASASSSSSLLTLFKDLIIQINEYIKTPNSRI